MTNPMINPVIKMLIDLPSPNNISLWWNFGSLLSVCLSLQLITGILLSFHYSNEINKAFFSVIHISRDVYYGWMLRSFHANGASVFFIMMYLHIGRSLYYGGYNLSSTWSVGVVLLLLVMATSFFGYVLPWGQMSFWGTTVITNLLSAIPYVGLNIVNWIWGGFAVGGATLTRFFSFHFILPFIIISGVLIHLIFLHQTGSNNPLGLSLQVDKLPFSPFFSLKDSMGSLILSSLFILISLSAPTILGDPENFIPANPLMAPIHIQPEWYFLFAYAILRSVPNKLGGVLALVGSIFILFILPLFIKMNLRSSAFLPVISYFIGLITMTVFLLTWIGAKPVEAPYSLTGQILSSAYFMLFFFLSPLQITWNFLFK